MSKFLSYLTSLALIGAVYSTSIIENTTYETLVFVVVWALILLGGFVGGVFAIALMMLKALKDNDIPAEAIKQWKSIDKPRWWLSIPLMFGWLWAFSVVGWTVTAVAYLFETTLLLTVSYMMYTKFKQFADEDEDDLIQYVKDSAVRDGLYKAREEKRNS